MNINKIDLKTRVIIKVKKGHDKDLREFSLFIEIFSILVDGVYMNVYICQFIRLS